MSRDLFTAPGMAVLSPDGRFRYSLHRSLGGDGPRPAIVMLNPSTGDAADDDPTIRKLIGFGRRLGWSGFEIVNLFAWRGPNPSNLAIAQSVGRDVVGPDNDRHIREARDRAPFVVVAWGAHVYGTCRQFAPERVAAVLGLLTSRRCEDGHALSECDESCPRTELKAWGRSKGGSPRHPLMISYSTLLLPLAATAPDTDEDED